MKRTIQAAAAIGMLAIAFDAARASDDPAFKTYLGEIDTVAEQGPFQPNWKSLEGFQVPKWYVDGKFGIFIHWGAYSVPAFGNEWYPREMYNADKSRRGVYQHHLDTYGSPAEYGYQEFLKQFKAERFDAKEWAKLFKDSGAKYIVPVAEHHDGFPLYDYTWTDWSAVKMGPERDVIGELSKAVRKEGLVFGASSHRAENWWFYGEGRKIESDVTDERYRGLYGPARDRQESEDQKTPPDQAFMDDWLVRTCELVDKYQPQLIWFDWWIAQPAFAEHLQKFSAFYYNRGAEWHKGVAINYKKHGGESFPDSAGVLDIERGQLAEIRSFFWQTDTSVSKTSWGYVTNHDYKTVDSIVDDLIDIVSKNGALLLNIGPKPDGTIPDKEVEMLLKIGGWLDINGDAIYGTRPWKKYGEGPTEVIEGTFQDTKRKAFTAGDFRFTTKGKNLYAIALALPEDGKLTIRSLATGNGEVKRVRLLGHRGRLDFEQTADGLQVVLPDDLPSDYAIALRMNGKGLTE